MNARLIFPHRFCAKYMTLICVLCMLSWRATPLHSQEGVTLHQEPIKHGWRIELHENVSGENSVTLRLNRNISPEHLEADLAAISAFGQVTCLVFENGLSLSSHHLDIITSITSLTELRFVGTGQIDPKGHLPFSINDLNKLGKLQNLTVLCIEDWPFSDQNSSDSGCLKEEGFGKLSLKSLSIKGSRFSKNDLEVLSKMASLQTLTLTAEVNGITFQEIAHCSSSLKNLRQLVVYASGLISNKSFREFVTIVNGNAHKVSLVFDHVDTKATFQGICLEDEIARISRLSDVYLHSCTFSAQLLDVLTKEQKDRSSPCFNIYFANVQRNTINTSEEVR